MKKATQALLKGIKRYFQVQASTLNPAQGGTSVINEGGRGLSGERPSSSPVGFKYEEFDHLEIVSGNPKQSAFYYASMFGFEVIECEDVYNKSNRVCYYLKNGGVRFLISGSIEPNDQATGEFLMKHGDAVRRVGLRVDDVDAVKLHLGKRGLAFEEEEGDSLKTVSLDMFENIRHVFIERNPDSKWTDAFWPGLSDTSSVIGSLNKANEFFNSHGCFIPEFIRIDHIGFPQPRDASTRVINSYYSDLGFYMFWFIDEKAISSKQSSLKSTVVSDFDNRIRFPIFEPVEKQKKSQIQEFLDFNGGAGAQHIALEIRDILTTVKHMRERGVEFLSVNTSYYDIVRQKLREYKVEVKEDFQEIMKHNILLDFDKEGNYLLQIFTKPLIDRPTLFLEFIQRNGHEGFGEGNFNRLFLSIEQEQKKRGNLV